MITGAHVIIHSTNPDADRAFLREVPLMSGARDAFLSFGATKEEAQMPLRADDSVRMACRPLAFRLVAFPVVLIWGEIMARNFLRGVKRRAEKVPIETVGTRRQRA